VTGTRPAAGKCRSVQVNRASTGETRSRGCKTECCQKNGLHPQWTV